MGRKNRLIAGIDIGTTKICVAVAAANGPGLRVLGSGTVPSTGLRKGVVVNLSETIDSIRGALELAEERSKTVVESAYVSLGSAYLRGVNRCGTTEVRGRNNEISPEDIQRAVAAAREMDITEGYEVIHVLTQKFEVDGQDGIDDPKGMHGHELSVHLHLVLTASSVLQNIVSAVNKAGVVADGVVMQQLASAESILSDDEKDLGVFLVDIGGGTTDLAVYSQGAIWHSEVFPLGGNLITKDIAIGTKTPISEAEQVKKEVGSVFPESVPVEELVEITEVGSGREKTIQRQFVCRIIQARCDELLNRVAGVTQAVGVNNELATGVVLTGGGAMLDGFRDRAETILRMPVRIGYPVNLVAQDHEIYHPAFCTALGLLRYAHELRNGVPSARAKPIYGRSKGRTDRLKRWLLETIS